LKVFCARLSTFPWLCCDWISQQEISKWLQLMSLSLNLERVLLILGKEGFGTSYTFMNRDGVSGPSVQKAFI
jgi:hypothetical protein